MGTNDEGKSIGARPSLKRGKIKDGNDGNGSLEAVGGYWRCVLVVIF